MGLDTERLDKLVELKRIKGHKITKAESDEYASLWAELIAEEGCFSDRAEYYLYEGLIFNGARPFVQWLLASDNKSETLNALFSGSFYGRETLSTFRILISTLAQLIKFHLFDEDLICPIIKRVPQASMNKEKKLIGDGHRIILKYFISELGDTTEFPSLGDLSINPAFVGSFVKVFDELLKKIDVTKITRKEEATYNRIIIWLHPVADVVSTNPECIPSENLESKENELPLDVDLSSLSEEELFLKLNDSMKQMSTIVDYICNNISKQRNELIDSISYLQKENDTLSVQLDLCRQRENSLSEQLTEKNGHIFRLNDYIAELEHKNEELSEIISARDEEITQRAQMIEALSRDRTKQSDELAHRIASKLRIEFKDFKDAESIPMDSDLGENMREQLKNVFSILSESGIALE